MPNGAVVMLSAIGTSWNNYRSRLSAKVRFQIYRQLYRLLATKRRSEIDALNILYDQYSNGGRDIKNRVARVIDRWRSGVRSGQRDGLNYGTLAGAMAQSVPMLEGAILSAGSGPHLVSAIGGISRVISVEIEVRRKVGKALIVPKIASGILLAIMVAMHHIMLPFLAVSKPIDQWSGLPWLLAGLAYICAQIWPFLMVYMIFKGALATYVMERWGGFGREIADKYLPGFRLYRITTGISFLFVLTAFARAKVDDTKALQSFSERASPYVRSRLSPVLKYLHGQGGRVGTAMMQMENPWPSRDIIRNLATVEPTKESPLHEQLAELAELELAEISAQVEIEAATYQAIAFIGITGFIALFIFSLASLVIDQVSTMAVPM